MANMMALNNISCPTVWSLGLTSFFSFSLCVLTFLLLNPVLCLACLLYFLIYFERVFPLKVISDCMFAQQNIAIQKEEQCLLSVELCCFLLQASFQVVFLFSSGLVILPIFVSLSFSWALCPCCLYCFLLIKHSISLVSLFFKFDRYVFVLV